MMENMMNLGKLLKALDSALPNRSKLTRITEYPGGMLEYIAQCGKVLARNACDEIFDSECDVCRAFNCVDTGTLKMNYSPVEVTYIMKGYVCA